MKKNRTYGLMDKIGLLKMIKMMRFTIFIVLLSLSQSFAISSYSQQTKLSLDMRNARVEDVLDRIEKNSDFFFMYNKGMVDVERKIDIQVEEKNVNEVLNKIFANTDVSYSIKDRQILLINNHMAGTGNESIFQQQQKTVSGKVTDSTGAGLPGVTVVVKGTTTGVITDNNGKYSLSGISENAVLQFSFVGLKGQEINVGNKTTIDVVLEEETVGIEEVVAIGYGTQKKRDIIGSIASVKSDVLESASGVSNFTSLLQGQAAGASVQTLSGRLGADVNIKIRGLSSISAGTSPLWIIDGVPVITSAGTGADWTTPSQSPMSMINQADIESIDILKDAAATSIYGSRGSNGVILVTTKSGVKGKTIVALDYSTGISDLPSQRPEFIGTKEWFALKDASRESYGLTAYEMSDFYAGQTYGTEYLTREQAEKIETDWFKEAMRQGSFQNVNFSAYGGDQKARFYVSSNYRKDQGVMLNEDLERYGLRANVDLEASTYFKVGAKLNFSLSNNNQGVNASTSDSGNNGGNSGGFSFLNKDLAPITPVYSLANPNLYHNPYLGNPIALTDPKNMVQDLKMYRTLASVYGEYTFPFLEDLSVRTELSLDFVQANRNKWISKEIRWNGSLGQDGARTSRTFNYNVFLNYNKSIGNHTINAVGGTEAQRGNSWFRFMSGQNLVGAYQELGTPSQMVSMSSGINGEGYLLAYFGRANYKFKDKYLAGFSVRRDGSSVFTPDYRWGTFYALSAGWILSEETFMSGFGNNNFLKLRGSFGQTGNASIPSSLDASKYTNGLGYGSTYILGTNGTLLSSIGVTNLTWETTNNFDFGLDFGFMNNRINGSLAYYNKYVEDLLLASALPFSSGIGSMYGNIGDLVNSGIEFNVASTNIESKNLKWQTSFNISFNHNEVKKLTPLVDEAGTGMVESYYISKVGSPVRDYFLADHAGINPQTGLPMLYARDPVHYAETGETIRLKDDAGNDVQVLDNSANANTNRFHLKDKNQIPSYYGGITNKITYKAFDLGFLVTFSGGNYIYDTFMRDAATGLSYTMNVLKEVADNTWKKPGDIAKYQRLNWKGNVKMEDGTTVGLGDARNSTNQFLFKGDYVKLKSVTLGYTLPPTSSAKKIFQDLRVYTSVENLYTITEYPGWDPEGQGQVGLWDLPQLFSATVGLSVKF